MDTVDESHHSIVIRRQGFQVMELVQELIEHHTPFTKSYQG